MEGFVLLVRIAIIAVLVVSGTAKLRDREGTAEAMIGFSVPLRFVSLGSVLLPILELALASGLVFAGTVLPASILTTMLFLVFAIAVGRVVMAGENLECHCFGQLSSGPITGVTLTRNVVLTMFAAVVWWWAQVEDATNIWDGWSGELGVVAAITLGFAVMGNLLLRLWQNQLALIERVEELQAMIPAGRAASPPIEDSFARVVEGIKVKTVEGESLPVASLKQKNSPAMLVFVSSGCRACNALMPDLATWQQEFDGLMPIHVIGTGDHHQVIEKTAENRIQQVYFRDGNALDTALKVHGNPTAVLVDHDGFVRAKPMLGGNAIRRAIEELRRQATGE